MLRVSSVYEMNETRTSSFLGWTVTLPVRLQVELFQLVWPLPKLKRMVQMLDDVVTCQGCCVGPKHIP